MSSSKDFSDPLNMFAAESAASGAQALPVNISKIGARDDPATKKLLADELADFEKSIAGVSAKFNSRPVSNSVEAPRTPQQASQPTSARPASTKIPSVSAQVNFSASDVQKKTVAQTTLLSSPILPQAMSAVPQATTDETTDDDIELLTGETNLMRLKNISIQKPSGRHIPITLIMTTYRMMLVPSRSHSIALAGSNPSILSQLNIPLGCIERIDREKKPKDSRVPGTTLLIQCKDIRHFRLYISGPEEQMYDGPPMSDSEIDRAFEAMRAYAFPTDIRYVFAFIHCHALPAAIKAQGPHLIYDAEVNISSFESINKIFNLCLQKEFIRQGILDENGKTPQHGHWRLSSANWEYRLCDTYPRQIIVPVRISDDDLSVVANFRSGRRLPALTWGKPNTAASIWRSSQPTTGVSGTCPQDELILDLIAQARGIRVTPLGLPRNLSESMLAIIDCRPRTNALANRAAGAGYEIQKNYPNTRLEFYDIPNIHAVRDSCKAVSALFQTYNGGTAQQSASTGSQNSETNFGRIVEDTQWLQNIRYILKASWDCAQIVQRGTPVLVHCSHGWDRTSQVVALAQIMLDSYYRFVLVMAKDASYTYPLPFRTFDGFQVLIEKDWISFGHAFLMRSGHLLNSKEDEISPIFLQFLDCVYQLVRQFPHYFEFGPRYILTIADHIYSCRFGTFLMNCDADRVSNRSQSLFFLKLIFG